MLLPFKFGLGGRLGSGEQWMSWIVMEDAIGNLRVAIANEKFAGALNVVAPNPLRNSEFTRIAASVLHRPAILVAPTFALRLAFGEMADALVIASQRVVPERLTELGYKFRFPEFEPALGAILDRAK